MPRHSAEQIYEFARAAGFTADEATTMTAIALAESGGRSTAHNSSGEDSRGLWQINADAHPALAAKYDLFDPRQNAQAAYEVSRNGSDISPWTTTHGGADAPYLDHRDEALAAAANHGDQAAVGFWDGTAGYGSPAAAGRSTRSTDSSGEGAQAVNTADATVPGESAGGSAGVLDGLFADDPELLDHSIPEIDRPDLSEGMLDHAIPEVGEDPTERPSPRGSPEPSATLPAGTSTAGSTNPLPRFVELALSQSGDPYVFGATVDLEDSDPTAFDCSELTKWAAAQAGSPIPDGAWLQYLWAEENGFLVPVEEALDVPGALLFSFSTEPQPGGGRPSQSHVAINMGDGETIEARGRAYGVGSFEASESRFQYAAVVPDLVGTAGTSPPAAGLTSDPTVPGTDYETWLAAQAERLQVDFAQASRSSPDTDGDGLTDAFERRAGLDPFSADTDADGLSDSEELLEFFTDPLRANTDGDLHGDGQEVSAGTDPTDADEDRDGHLDGADRETWVDTDGDGLDDDLESARGWSSSSIDSDGDGLVDRLETPPDHSFGGFGGESR